jgi:hypothetical protein
MANSEKSFVLIDTPDGGFTLVNLALVRTIEVSPTGGSRLSFDPAHTVKLDLELSVKLIKLLEDRILQGKADSVQTQSA